MFRLSDAPPEIGDAARHRLVTAVAVRNQLLQFGFQVRQSPLRSFALKDEIREVASPLLLGLGHGARHDMWVGPDRANLPGHYSLDHGLRDGLGLAVGRSLLLRLRANVMAMAARDFRLVSADHAAITG